MLNLDILVKFVLIFFLFEGGEGGVGVHGFGNVGGLTSVILGGYLEGML